MSEVEAPSTETTSVSTSTTSTTSTPSPSTSRFSFKNIFSKHSKKDSGDTHQSSTNLKEKESKESKRKSKSYKRTQSLENFSKSPSTSENNIQSPDNAAANTQQTPTTPPTTTTTIDTVPITMIAPTGSLPNMSEVLSNGISLEGNDNNNNNNNEASSSSSSISSSNTSTPLTESTTSTPSELVTPQNSTSSLMKQSPQGADSVTTNNNRRSWSEQLDSDKENFVNDLNEQSVLSHPSFCEPSRVKRIKVANVTIIFNPMSGSKIGEKIMVEAKKYFEVHGIKVHVIPTEYKGHAEVLCRTLDIEGIDVVCLVGGDGTIHEAVNGIMKRDPESRERFVMACLPAGTGNSFVLELQGKLSIKHVCERVVNGLTVPIDIAKVTIVGKSKISAECSRRKLEYNTLKKKFAHVNLDASTLSSSQEAGRRSIQAYRQIRPDALMEYGSTLSNQFNSSNGIDRAPSSSDLGTDSITEGGEQNNADDSTPEPIYCFNSLHWGLGSKVNITAEKMRWMGKAVRYTTAALLELCRGERILARIEYEDANGEVTALEDEFCLAIVNNIQGAAKGMKMAPKAKLNDGLIDLILVKSHKTFDLMNIFTKVYDGTHTELDYVIYKQVKRFSITPFKKDKERKKRLRKEKKRIKAAIKAGREHSKNPLEILKTECNTILSELEDQIDEEIIDIDGELKGQTPFVCEMIPRSVRVVV
ncbi:hypothetical protein RB653_010251 [Dictyostelium firmibasis]|uniref:DAGKc domain-containing protein n=1 Tax=Dictyostelium firmibasis TaxID=79012 RepID=A0AAN7YMF5_9MYCE